MTRSVGIRELKARLSEYLRIVKGGESVLITERDRVVAEIRPTERQDLAENSIEKVLAKMSEAGRVTLRAGEPDLRDWPSSELRNPGIPVGELLDELRGDR